MGRFYIGREPGSLVSPYRLLRFQQPGSRAYATVLNESWSDDDGVLRLPRGFSPYGIVVDVTEISVT